MCCVRERACWRKEVATLPGQSSQPAALYKAAERWSGGVPASLVLHFLLNFVFKLYSFHTSKNIIE